MPYFMNIFRLQISLMVEEFMGMYLYHNSFYIVSQNILFYKGSSKSLFLGILSCDIGSYVRYA